MTSVVTQAGKSGMSQWALGLLPTPHLLDAAWWFDAVTVEAFRAEIEALPRRAEVVFLGTPSLFLDTWQRNESRSSYLVDRDRAIQNRLPVGLRSRMDSMNLLNELPRLGHADLVIADPPWYVEETMAFLRAGQAVSRVGAQVLICLPPKGTRPSIEQERKEFFYWAATGGMRLKRVLEGRVRYEAPPFERNVFRSTGQPLDQQSRLGDLAIFDVEHRSGLTLQLGSAVVEWQDHTLLDVRWRVREEPEEKEASPVLTTLGFCDDIFPSCSKRHVDREKPSVWTSGNRTFCCDNPQRFLAILRSMDGATLKQVEASRCRLYPRDGSEAAKAADQILVLLGMEQREIEALKQCPNGKEM